jgi:excinuclease ABC subunit C
VAAPLGRELLAARAREAPPRPGVYFFFGPDRALLYIGKASSLRRRLSDHARGPANPDNVKLEKLSTAVRDVRWVECRDEHEALCREADLVVAIAPPFNASMAFDAYTYIAVVDAAASRVRFALTEDAARARGRVYGAFPHLGKGKASWRAKRTNGGYCALLRLVWVAFAGAARIRIPSKLRGTSPPIEFETSLDPDGAPLLRDFLSGRSNRLLASLRDAVICADVPVFMHGALERDLAAAEEFYRLGPNAVRRFRTAHRLPRGPLHRDVFAQLLTDDIREAIGPFSVQLRKPRGPRRRVLPSGA